MPCPPQAALERGLVLDDFTIQQLIDEKDSFVAGQSGAHNKGLRSGQRGRSGMGSQGCLQAWRGISGMAWHGMSSSSMLWDGGTWLRVGMARHGLP